MVYLRLSALKPVRVGLFVFFFIILFYIRNLNKISLALAAALASGLR